MNRQPPTTRNQSGNSSSDDLRRVYITLVSIASIGVVGALLYSVFTTVALGAAIAVFGGALLVAGAFLLVGGLIGFLFAIPRSRQEQGPSQAPPATTNEQEKPRQRLSDYAANTNLEQISDWLTKILVGISLVQFSQMSDRFGAAASTLAGLLGSGPAARSVALALMTYFMLWGFFFAYLSTRLWLPKALSRAEREEARQVEKEASLRALERRTYDYLYQPPPGGYTRAIAEIEAYQAKPGAIRSGWLSAYLACAYGQRHKDEQARNDLDAARATEEKAVAAVEEALKLDSSTLPILAQLYKATDPNENDLLTLKGDPRLDELLGQ